MPGDRTPIGAVLAGGAATRLSGSKAALELSGRPLISYPLAAFAAAGIEVIVVAKPDTELPELEARVIREPAEPLHPLLGVIMALDRFPGRPVIASPCDVPFVPPDLLGALAAARGAATIRAGGRLHPLLARFPPTALPDLRQTVAEGASAEAAVRALRPKLIKRPEHELVNVNTPADLNRAVDVLRGDA